MHIPSPDQREIPSPMRVVLDAAHSPRSSKGSPPGAKQSACPSRLQPETGQANPEAALPLQASQGLEPRHKANARHTDTTHQRRNHPNMRTALFTAATALLMSASASVHAQKTVDCLWNGTPISCTVEHTINALNWNVYINGNKNSYSIEQQRVYLTDRNGRQSSEPVSANLVPSLGLVVKDRQGGVLVVPFQSP